MLPHNDNNVQNAATETEILPRPLFSMANKKNHHPMDDLLKTLGTGTLLKIGDIVQGTVVDKRGGRLFLDLGGSGIGVVYGREYMHAQEIAKSLVTGDTVSAKVIELDNDDGYIELSLQEAGREKRWVDMKRMMQEGTTLDLPVKKANTGGLIIDFMGVEGFLPASQLSYKHYPRVEGGDKEKIFQELQKLVGAPNRVRILDLNPAENKLIFTEKGLDMEEAKKLLAEYKVGDVVEGEITGVVDFGAFMKFNAQGLEGLIHLSEIDWTLVNDPRDILKSGDKVRAKIIDIQGDKVSLSLKQLKDDPWTNAADKYKKDDIIKGKVTKFNPFGAFVELNSDIQGLAHISEFGSEKQMREILTLGQTYSFRVLLIDPKEHRISLGVMKEGEQEHKKPENEPQKEKSE